MAKNRPVYQLIIFCSGRKLKGVAKYYQGVASAPPSHTLNDALHILLSKADGAERVETAWLAHKRMLDQYTGSLRPCLVTDSERVFAKTFKISCYGER